ncbi:MAG: hypothetical protein M3O61_00100 [Gemmatimonadota bacterium]|nr:hypothetical protein [Gemmatimonadota bacterium]
MSVRLFTAASALIVLMAPARAHTQASDDVLQILRLESTPIGALPPIALPMPASRNHDYWGVRLQAGQRVGRGAADLGTLAAGIDFQYRGGSIVGITGGYQKRDCDLAGPDCGAHALFGLRSRINLITGGPTIGALFGDKNATSTLGGEMGFGFAPNMLPDMNACTIDLGMPLSVSMLQRVRVVSYITPGFAWDFSCGSRGPPAHGSWLTGFGLGIQQFGNRSTDIFVGVQKIFRGGTGYQFGIAVTYVRLP